MSEGKIKIKAGRLLFFLVGDNFYVSEDPLTVKYSDSGLNDLEAEEIFEKFFFSKNHFCIIFFSPEKSLNFFSRFPLPKIINGRSLSWMTCILPWKSVLAADSRTCLLPRNIPGDVTISYGMQRTLKIHTNKLPENIKSQSLSYWCHYLYCDTSWE